MELPLELGAYIQSFLKPTQSIYDTLRHRYPTKWQRICAKQRKSLFRNYYANYSTYTTGTIVTLHAYLGDIKLRHIQVMPRQLKKIKASVKRYEDIFHDLQLPFDIVYGF